eukprot:5972013-Amphidinium_carterae.1
MSLLPACAEIHRVMLSRDFTESTPIPMKNCYWLFLQHSVTLTSLPPNMRKTIPSPRQTERIVLYVWGAQQYATRHTVVLHRASAGHLWR